MASISPAPLNTPNSRTFVALTRPRPSSSSRYCQRYPTRGPAFRLTMAKTVPSRGRRYRASPIGSPASPASPSNAGRPPAEETSVSALPSPAIRNTRSRRRRRSVRTAMSVAWPCSISPYSTSTLLGRSMPASVCRTLPSNPKATSAPLGAGALFVPRIRLRSGTDAWIQTAGSSGSSDTDAVARAGRTSTGTWAGEQAAQNIAPRTEPSRVSVRTVSFCARRRGRRARAAGIAGPRGTRALPRRGWAPSGDAGSVAGGRERTPHPLVKAVSLRRRGNTSSSRVIRGSSPEHGHQYDEQPVDHAADRPRVPVSALAQCAVMPPRGRIVLRAHATPVIERVPKAVVAGVAHADEHTLPALAGDGGDGQGGGVKLSEHRLRRPPPNAMPSEQAGERCAAQRARGNRGRGELEQRPDPRLVDRRTEPEHLGIEPLQLLPQAIGQAPELRLQLLLGARQFPELNKQRVIDVHLPERGPVGAQRVGQDETVPPVVLGSRGAVAVAKAIELLGIDGEHVEAALEQGLHDGPARHFDGDGDPRRLTVGEGRQPIRHLAQGAARVLDPAPSLQAALGREHRELVSLARPVHPNVKCVRTLAHAPSLSDPRLTVVSRPTLYWRSRRDSPLDVHHGRPRWGATPFQVLRALGPAGEVGRGARPVGSRDRKNGTGSRRPPARTRRRPDLVAVVER